jgi:hypothetical protein
MTRAPAPPTHRPLPDDPGVGALDAQTRARVARAWRARARNELSTSTVFASITRALVGLDAPHPIIRSAARAVADEVRHAEICVHVAGAYAGDAVVPEAGTVAIETTPASGDASDLAAVLFVVLQSCINEGVACAYLQACLSEATGLLARAAVRDILEDEIEHARFGWAFLSSPVVRPAWRDAIAEALPTLCNRVVDCWLDPGAGELVEIPVGHGAIDASALPGVVGSALRDLVLPGFAHVGIDVRRAERWLAARA